MKLRILFLLVRGVVGTILFCFAIWLAGCVKPKYGVNVDWLIVLLLFLGVVFSIVFIGQPISAELGAEKKERIRKYKGFRRLR